MGKDKLKRFKENESFKNLFQPNRKELLDNYTLKGNWNRTFFKNENPIVLELGCGHGDYTVALAEKTPDKNYIGVDVKGARIWKGAKYTNTNKIKNAAFIRSQIELLDYIFEKGEISEIWITFPDPQILYRRTKHRLTSPIFLSLYKKVLSEQGTIHLKTDDAFLHGYTLGILQGSNKEIIIANHDIYKRGSHLIENEVVDVKTHYEKKFLEKGKPITYIQFKV